MKRLMNEHKVLTDERRSNPDAIAAHCTCRLPNAPMLCHHG